MNIRPQSPALLRWLTRLAVCALLGLFLPPGARADMATVRNRSKGPIKNLVRYFPAPTGVPTKSSTLFVAPLLGPARELLPKGKLMVWVGLNNGSPYQFANVTLRVPIEGNDLVSAGQRMIEVVLHTNAEGLAEIFLAAPNVPPINKGKQNGGGE